MHLDSHFLLAQLNHLEINNYNIYVEHVIAIQTILTFDNNFRLVLRIYGCAISRKEFQYRELSRRCFRNRYCSRFRYNCNPGSGKDYNWCCSQCCSRRSRCCNRSRLSRQPDSNRFRKCFRRSRMRTRKV